MMEGVFLDDDGGLWKAGGGSEICAPDLNDDVSKSGIECGEGGKVGGKWINGFRDGERDVGMVGRMEERTENEAMEEGR